MNQQSAALTPIRRHDIDWLRIFAVYSFIVFQAVWVLNAGSSPRVKGGGLPGYVSGIGLYISQWYVPLIFLISGWSRKISMQQRAGIDSMRERMYRLVIPFATGCILTWPLIAYLGLIDRSYTAGRRVAVGDPHARSYLDFLPDCFTNPCVHAWSHLWLLPVLFVFTLLSWPFFSWMLKKKVTPLKISRVWVYFPIIPLTFLQAGMSPTGSGMESFLGTWAGAAYVFVYYLVGFTISRYSAYERAIHQEARHAGIIGVSLFLSMRLLSSSLAPQALAFMGSIAGWCFAAAVLGFAKRYLDYTTAWFPYLRDSILPVYVFHQIPILVFGLLIIRLDLGASPRYLLLLISSVSATATFYHFLVRRSPFLQVFFGMKPGREPAESWRDQILHRDRG